MSAVPATVAAVPLSAEAFRPYGDVIEAAGAADMMINGGRCARYHDRARLSFEDGGRAGVSLFRSEASPVPYPLTLMERHPLGSQAFVPMSPAPFLIVVAADVGGRPGDIRAFLAAPHQGVNYLPGVWHAPLIALENEMLFCVVDRIGSGENLEEHRLEAPLIVTL